MAAFSFHFVPSAVLGFSATGLSQLDLRLREVTVTEMVQVLDALFNIVFLVGAAIIFLVSMENRAKRKKVIKAVKELEDLTTGLSRKIWQKIMTIKRDD